jgi:hypothetical protein
MLLIARDDPDSGPSLLYSDTSWRRAHSSDGWSRWDDPKRVVFFTGMKIIYNLFGAHENPEKKWRGRDNNKEFVVTGLESGMDADATVEMFGDDWDVIEEDRLEKEEEAGNEDDGNDD